MSSVQSAEEMVPILKVSNVGRYSCIACIYTCIEFALTPRICRSKRGSEFFSPGLVFYRFGWCVCVCVCVLILSRPHLIGLKRFRRMGLLCQPALPVHKHPPPTDTHTFFFFFLLLTFPPLLRQHDITQPQRLSCLLTSCATLFSIHGLFPAPHSLDQHS